MRAATLRGGFGCAFVGLVGGGLLTWLFVVGGLQGIAANLYDNLRPLLLGDYGYDEAQIGLLFSLLAVVYILTSLFASRLADRWSAAGTVALGGLVESLALIVLATLTGGALIFPLYFVLSGLGSGLRDPAFSSLLARAAPRERLGTTFGLFRAAASFLTMPAPYVGSLLWENVSPLASFWVGAVFTALASVAAWSVLRPRAAPATAIVADCPTPTSIQGVNT